VAAPFIGAFMIVSTLWSLRRPAGLELDEKAMRGVRGGPSVDLEWSQLADVKVVQVKKGRALMLMTIDGPIQIREGNLGGDVYAVATVVGYYLHHSTERSRLSAGVDAVRHVDSEVRAGRFSAL
jgi:hypothetical protein